LALWIGSDFIKRDAGTSVIVSTRYCLTSGLNIGVSRSDGKQKGVAAVARENCPSDVTLADWAVAAANCEHLMRKFNIIHTC
jgi:hypothetical protein